MNTLEKFNRRVIELIHGLPYDEAVEKEEVFKPYWEQTSECCGAGIFSDGCCPESEGVQASELCMECHAYCDVEKQFYPITIGRVMQALYIKTNEKSTSPNNCFYVFGDGEIMHYKRRLAEWKLTKENWQEADSSHQSEETIEALYNLIKEV